METKTCSITEDEIKALILVLAREMDGANIEDSLERMSYLNRRLKAEKKEGRTEADIKSSESGASAPAAQGWT